MKSVIDSLCTHHHFSIVIILHGTAVPQGHPCSTVQPTVLLVNCGVVPLHVGTIIMMNMEGLI
jgi:hypothetical protein